MNVLMTGAVGDVGQTLVARMKMVKLNNRLANPIICAAIPTLRKDANWSQKPRIIVTSDGEIDDQYFTADSVPVVCKP